jgi:4-hydroxybenzoate polyprenyltransferase
MADLPAHPDSADDPSAGPEHLAVTGRPRRTALLGVAVAVVLVVLMLVLHLAGVLGPGSH